MDEELARWVQNKCCVCPFREDCTASINLDRLEYERSCICIVVDTMAIEEEQGASGEGSESETALRIIRN